MPPVIQWLALFKTAVSTMITAMPVFIVKNFFRDTLAGFVAGRYPQVPFGGTLAGGTQAVRDLTTGRSEPMREYLLQGGFYSGLVESETHLADIRGEDGRGAEGNRGDADVVAAGLRAYPTGVDRGSRNPGQPVHARAPDRCHQVCRGPGGANGVLRFREHRLVAGLADVRPTPFRS